jgi:titin
MFRIFRVKGDQRQTPARGASRTRTRSKVLRLETLEDRCLLSTFTVVNTHNNGAGSLRAAINNSNATAGLNTIQFNIPGSGAHTIALTSPLPAIINSVIIDGTTQPGWSANTLTTADNGVLTIQLSGLALGGKANGLVITAGQSTVRGLAIDYFPGSGLVLQTKGGNVVQGDFIGTDPTGSYKRDNGADGIVISKGSSANQIGGASPGQRNLISGNGSSGVLIDASNGNTVQNNFIGLINNGATVLANGGQGVFITDKASNNVVSGNVISGNGNNGVALSGGAGGNTIQGNLIGTNASGTNRLGNRADGIRIAGDASGNTVGGTTSGAGNVISGNLNDGIGIDNGITAGATNNLIEGNFIGTNATGDAGLPNFHDGVVLSNVGGNTIGGTATGAGNLISANAVEGVYIHGDATAGTKGNTIQGNLIGLTAAGNAILGNENRGILIDNASNNLIGGTVSGARNVIAGNGYAEIRIQRASATGNIVEGNYLGTDTTGTKGLPNSTYGVRIAGGSQNQIGGTTAAAANVISGNLLDGVRIDNGEDSSFGVASKNVVEGNLIGVQSNGTGALPNGDCGVRITQSANDNTISGNTIAYNALVGIGVGGTSKGNNFVANSIFANGLLGIDLGMDGVTANHSPASTTGPNLYENYPVLKSATSSAGTTTIKGSLASFANATFHLEFFASATGDSSKHGEGQTYLGSISVTTDANGNGSFTATFSVSVPAGQAVSSTSTDANGNTSEFSKNVSVTTPGPLVGLNSVWSGAVPASHEAGASASGNSTSPRFDGSAGPMLLGSGLATDSDELRWLLLSQSHQRDAVDFVFTQPTSDLF